MSAWVLILLLAFRAGDSRPLIIDMPNQTVCQAAVERLYAATSEGGNAAVRFAYCLDRSVKKP